MKIFLLLVAALSLLCSCKGRTADNMVPSGDTVEVIIKTPAGPDEEESHEIDTISNFNQNIDIE